MSAGDGSEWEGRGSNGEVKSQTLRLTADIAQKTTVKQSDIRMCVCVREKEREATSTQRGLNLTFPSTTVRLKFVFFIKMSQQLLDGPRG